MLCFQSVLKKHVWFKSQSLVHFSVMRVKRRLFREDLCRSEEVTTFLKDTWSLQEVLFSFETLHRWVRLCPQTVTSLHTETMTMMMSHLHHASKPLLSLCMCYLHTACISVLLVSSDVLRFLLRLFLHVVLLCEAALYTLSDHRADVISVPHTN